MDNDKILDAIYSLIDIDPDNFTNWIEFSICSNKEEEMFLKDGEKDYVDSSRIIRKWLESKIGRKIKFVGEKDV